MIANVLGVLLLIVGSAMFLGIGFSLYYQSNDALALLGSGAITLTIGGLLLLFSQKRANNNIKKREGYLVVTLGWLLMSFCSMLPYLFSGTIPDITNAFFETMSGLTTTGASVLNDIEGMPKGILFWRSLTQWIGGMGIIVLAIAILPILGIGGMELFVAEAPGPTSDKLHPRIKETAKRLWGIYLFVTFLCMLSFWIAGMNFYDAVNHGLTTMATGGFSTKQDSMAYFPPLIQYIAIFFMFVAGTNYSLIFVGLQGKLSSFWKNDEFRAYSFTTLSMTALITATVYIGNGGSFEVAFRDTLFQVVSLITTTGFVSADYLQWPTFAMFLCFLLMFSGGSAGSTSGGIKIIRHLTMFKNCLLEFKRLMHKRAVLPVIINQTVVSSTIITNILVFILLFLLMFILGALALTLLGMDFVSAISASATAIGNVGPGLGSVGPVENFYHISDGGKWILSFLMLVGRLELFTVLILFTPYFWKAN